MKVSLLIVDDEIKITQMLQRHFQFLGFDVHIASDGIEALKVLEQHHIHIVVSDIMMPNMNGVQLLAEIREHYPMIQVIMITGYVTINNALSTMREGARTCIFKPLEDLTLLEDAVNNAVKHVKQWIDILDELRAMKPQEAGV